MKTIENLGKKAEIQQEIDNLNKGLEVNLQKISGVEFTPIIYNYDDSIVIKFMRYRNNRLLSDYSLWIKAKLYHPVLSNDYSLLQFSGSTGGDFDCNDENKILEMKTLISFTENSAKIWDLIYQYHIEISELDSELRKL